MGSLEAHLQILDALAEAERLRARALAALARLPLDQVGSGFLFRPELQHVLRARHSRLAACHGYRGHAIGWKYRGGRADTTTSVTVFVRKKLSKRQLARATGEPVPRWLQARRGPRFDTDVVELRVGRKERITPGSSIGGHRRNNPGTLTCFAYNAEQELVGLTAGHVAKGATHYRTPSGGPLEFGFLRSLSLSPIDAATIVVTSSWSQIFPNGSHMIGVRALTDHDVGKPVYIYGAESGGWSLGTVKYLAPWIASWKLADAIVYSAPTLPGDSGGPVIDQHGYLIGMHIGRGTYQGADVAIAGSIARVAHDLKLTPFF